MQKGLAILIAVLSTTLVGAQQPATRPARAQPKSGLSIQEAEAALGLLGPVRVANRAQPFLAPARDPHQRFRDRHTYATPTFFPYCFPHSRYWTYPYFHCGYSTYPATTTIFYGD